MKRAFLNRISVAASLILVLQTGCQQPAKLAEVPAPAQAPTAKGEPKIKFESLVYDFGKVSPGQKLIGAFKFTNIGDAPLKITKVEKCCGVVTRLDKEQLAPGESGALQVQYTAGRTPGALSRNLYINSNDKAAPRAQLTIRAETVLKVAYEPRSIRLLPTQENAACPKITLTSTDNKPFSITSFTATNGALTAEIDPSVEATKFVIEPKADLTKLQKTRTGRISIALAYPPPGTPPETISIIFQALARFTIRPSMLVVLYDNAEPVKKTLSITNNTGEPLEIESTASSEGRIKVLSQNKAGGGYQFSLEITPPGGDVKRFTDTFTVTLKGGETIEVPCRGMYRAPTPAKAAQ